MLKEMASMIVENDYVIDRDIEFERQKYLIVVKQEKAEQAEPGA